MRERQSRIDLRSYVGKTDHLDSKLVPAGAAPRGFVRDLRLRWAADELVLERSALGTWPSNRPTGLKFETAHIPQASSIRNGSGQLVFATPMNQSAFDGADRPVKAITERRHYEYADQYDVG